METTQAAEKKIVLIVEDDDITRKLLTIEFKRRGHMVIEYGDAATALAAIQREKPPVDAAVVDLMNIGYGGNLGDFMRKFPEYRDTKIIFTLLLRNNSSTAKS